MNYQEIDTFMRQTGLDKEPAFEFLHFLTEPIQSPDDRRILGLFYPEGEESGRGIGYLPPSTIILPPDATEGTLLHELGHRYGVYYYNDLSETFAENYRAQQEKKLSPTYAGSYARQEVRMHQNISQEKSYPLAVARAGDWSVDGFEFLTPPASIKAGQGISLDISGLVNDLMGNFPDQWQVAVFVAYSSADGNTIARSDAKVYQSGIWGSPLPYSDKINLTDYFHLVHYNLGAMPSRNIQVFAEVYANHDASPAFIPGTFAQRSSNGWEYVSTIVLEILLDNAPPPPPGGTGMQLYQQASTNEAKTYQGKAQTAVFTFSTGPEQLDFINNFFVNQMITECKKAIQQQSPGDHLLFLQLYRDTSSTLQTNYELHLTATDVTGGPLPWAAIIYVALAIILYYMVIRPVLNTVEDIIWGPGSSEGKPPRPPLSNPLVILGVAGAFLVGIALVKGTSVKGAVTGR